MTESIHSPPQRTNRKASVTRRPHLRPFAADIQANAVAPTAASHLRRVAGEREKHAGSGRPRVGSAIGRNEIGVNTAAGPTVIIDPNMKFARSRSDILVK